MTAIYLFFHKIKHSIHRRMILEIRMEDKLRRMRARGPRFYARAMTTLTKREGLSSSWGRDTHPCVGK